MYNRFYIYIYVHHEFLFFPENGFWHFMQIVSLGDNLQKNVRAYFLGKNKNKYQFVISRICPEGAMVNSIMISDSLVNV